MLDKIIEYDKELFLFLNNLGNENWDAFWMFMTHKLSAIPLYLFLLILCIKKLGYKQTLLVLVLVALMITATDQLANVFKYGFERLRPCHDDTVFNKMRLVKSYCGGKFGYFSAHAANSFTVATFFSLLFNKSIKWLPALLLLWALIVAYSRIYIGVHFPLDVVTGICIGLLFGWLFYFLFCFFRKRFSFFINY
ncbi:phosphatase PAP2 family protein [Abyssalbus ytuae]|uniref:Phosphatase PAP2 family protein n=1 Tax=Abyssalbus ytuae TaxID=2926907 RepID=A0A9E7D2C6_9FLAO|nr:phosphatase PAP2 family protein [Abyssalbus ytuae]UOB18023.1 phosphatase PAP2 family protein [Abyssalbus ytuae]